MKLFWFLILLTLAVGTPVYAGTSVSISSNGKDSRSSVSIKNSINASNNSKSDSSSETHIRIESNGEVKTYDSDMPGSIHLESSDGKNVVDINTSSTTKPEIKNGDQKAKDKIQTFLETIRRIITKQLSIRG